MATEAFGALALRVWGGRGNNASMTSIPTIKISQYMQSAIDCVKEAEAQARWEQQEKARKRAIVAEKREGYWATICDAIKADAKGWTVAMAGSRPITVLDITSGPAIRCSIGGDPRFVWLHLGEHGLTVGLQQYDGDKEKKKNLAFDVDESGDIQVRLGDSSGEILLIDKVIELVLEPLMFPKSRPTVPESSKQGAALLFPKRSQ